MASRATGPAPVTVLLDRSHSSLSGVTTADFINNSAGFMGAIDALGPAGTGEIAGTGSVVSTPEPSTWAMMMVGFAGLAYAGFRKTKKARALSLA